MGQNADDVICGLTCSLCGCFFVDSERKLTEAEQQADLPLHEHGYPVVCWDCWKDLTKQERKQYQRALKVTL